MMQQMNRLLTILSLCEMLGVYQDGATKATNNPPRDILSVHGDATNEGTNPPASEALD